MTINPAFEFLRKHKKVEEETETLVMKKVIGRITQDELITIFENGIAGQYGKIYSADPQTLLSWVSHFKKEKDSTKNYLQTSLLPVTAPGYETIDWFKEANKCYQAFLNGVSEQYFHRCVYDRMMLDDKIKLNAYMKHYSGNDLEEIYKAQRKVLRDVFSEYKNNGFTTVYFIK